MNEEDVQETEFGLNVGEVLGFSTAALNLPLLQNNNDFYKDSAKVRASCFTKATGMLSRGIKILTFCLGIILITLASIMIGTWATLTGVQIAGMFIAIACTLISYATGVFATSKLASMRMMFVDTRLLSACHQISMFNHVEQDVAINMIESMNEAAQKYCDAISE